MFDILRVQSGSAVKAGLEQEIAKGRFDNKVTSFRLFLGVTVLWYKLSFLYRVNK